MAHRGDEYPKFNLRLPDRRALEEVRLVGVYEAGRRACTFSQAIIEIALEQVDMSDYPDELRERIAELEEQVRREALERALSSGD